MRIIKPAYGRIRKMSNSYDSVDVRASVAVQALGCRAFSLLESTTDVWAARRLSSLGPGGVLRRS